MRGGHPELPAMRGDTDRSQPVLIGGEKQNENEGGPPARNGVTRAWSRCKPPKNLDLGRFERYTGRETRGAERNA